MFDIIEHFAMSVEIRCHHCHASLTVESGSRSYIKRSISDFERGHRCRNAALTSPTPIVAHENEDMPGKTDAVLHSLTGEAL